VKRELRDKWVTALRSGEYLQGYAMLHDPDTNRYCCLGVLVDIGKCNTPWTDYSWCDTVLGGSVTTETCIQMNDNGRMSFTKIADWIEQNIPAEE
jgi:hypothetical protein